MRGLENFLLRLSLAHRLLILVLIVACSAFLVSYVVGGWLTGVLVALVILAILWITKPLWKPEKKRSQKLQVALSSLTMFSGVMLAILGKTPEGKPLLERLLALFGHHAPGSG